MTLNGCDPSEPLHDHASPYWLDVTQNPVPGYQSVRDADSGAPGATQAEVSTLKTAKLSKIGGECVEFMQEALRRKYNISVDPFISVEHI